MKLTLRQARRLEREIDSLKQELQAHTESRSAVISIYQDFESTLKQKQEALVQAITTCVELTRIRFGIRKSIETDHEVSVLNIKMNEEALLKDQLKIYESLVHAELTDAELSIAQKRHAALVAKGAIGDEYGRTTDTTTVHAMLSKHQHDLMKAQVKDIKKKLLVLVDEMTSLNTTRTITISDADIAELEKFGIVV